MSLNGVVMYSTRFCPFCLRAKAILTAKNVTFHDIDVGVQPALRSEMMEKSGRHTVPQIWIGERHIGGCDELLSLDRSKKLDEMLAENSVDE